MKKPSLKELARAVYIRKAKEELGMTTREARAYAREKMKHGGA